MNWGTGGEVGVVGSRGDPLELQDPTGIQLGAKEKEKSVGKGGLKNWRETNQ